MFETIYLSYKNNKIKRLISLKNKFYRNSLIFILNSFLLITPQFKAKSNDLEIRYGIKLSPLISIFNSEGTGCSLENTLGFEAGVTSDFVFRTNHAFGIGLKYFINQLKVELKNKKYDFSVSYINAPFLLKFHSNEFWIDTQIFLYTGLSLGIKINENTPKEFHENKDLFKLFRTAFIIGAGIEYEFAMSTTAFIELGYKTDMFNIISIEKNSKLPLKSIYTHSILLAFGIRF